MVAHFALEIARGIVANDVNDASDIKLAESLGDSYFDLLMPLGHLYRLSVVAPMKDVEALLQVQ